MEEHQVTVDGTTYPLASPFMVIATQNPIEHEGTYPLPESPARPLPHADRHGLPRPRGGDRDARRPRRRTSAVERVTPVRSVADVVEMVAVARLVHVAPVLKGYLVDLATATRRHPNAAIGVSPRATLALQRAARAYAASIGREYIVPDDIKALAGPVLRTACAHARGRARRLHPRPGARRRARQRAGAQRPAGLRRRPARAPDTP